MGISTIFCAAILFAACGKECVCTTTRTTSTMHDVLTTEMGKMSEKDCQAYNGTVNDGVGVTRTIVCELD